MAAPASLVSLPDSLLLLVLGGLDRGALLRAARCCRELRRLGRDPALWAEIGGASVRSLLRSALRPPSLRHLRALFGADGSSAGGRPLAVSRSPAMPDADAAAVWTSAAVGADLCAAALDLSRLHPPAGAHELLPARAFAAVRLLRVSDQTLFYDLYGCEYLCRDVFGEGGAVIAPAPRAGAGLIDCSGERGLRHLIVVNRASAALAAAGSIGFTRLASSRAVPPLPSTLPTLRTSSCDEGDGWGGGGGGGGGDFCNYGSGSGPGFGSGFDFGGPASFPSATSSGSASARSASLWFEYSDVHLSLICFHLSSSLRTLELPFANCAFTPLGLAKLSFLTCLRTLAVGVRDLAAALAALPGAPLHGLGLRSLAVGVPSLRSEGAALQGARRLGTSAAIHAQAAQRRRDDAARERARWADRAARGSFIRAPPTAADQDDPSESAPADSRDPFALLATKFGGLRRLSLHWSQLSSAGGLDDVTVAQIRSLARGMSRLAQLRLALQPPDEAQERWAGRPAGAARTVDRLLRAAVSLSSALSSSAAGPHGPHEESLAASSSAPPPPRSGALFRHLMHGSCLAPLGECRRLAQLSLEGWSLFAGALAAWAGTPLATSLRSLTLVRCDLVGDSAAQLLAALPLLEYLELSRCRLGDGGLQLLLAGCAQSQMDESGSERSAAAIPLHPLQDLVLHQCVDHRGDDALLQLEWGPATTASTDNDPPPLSPLRHLFRLSQLRTLYILHADSGRPPLSERHALRLQALMAAHWAQLGAFLGRPSCQLRSLTLARASFSSEAAWRALRPIDSESGDGGNGGASDGGNDGDNDSDCYRSRFVPCRTLTALDVARSVGLSDAMLRSVIAPAFPRLLRLDISFARREQAHGSDFDFDQTQPDPSAAETAVDSQAAAVGLDDSQPISPQTTPIASESSAEPSAAGVATADSAADSAADPATGSPADAATDTAAHADTGATTDAAIDTATVCAADAASDPDSPIDPPLCPFTPAALLRLVGELRELRSLTALCSSAADTAAFVSGPWLRRCRDANPHCRILASRWQ